MNIHTPNPLVQENIPVVMNFPLKLKEHVHNFFRRPTIVKIFTFLPSFLFKKHKDLANLIMKCRQTFTNNADSLKDLTSKVYGGDTIGSLRSLQTIPRQSVERVTTYTFTTKNCLEQARDILDNINNPNERIAILNLANRWQAGGVGLAPYGGSQEEYLIRRSNLAWAVDSTFKKETIHKQLHDIRLKEGFQEAPFTHHIPYFGAVVTKNVTFIDKANPAKFDIISSAAPDLRKGSDESIYLKRFGTQSNKALHEILENKIIAIFEAAIAENIDHVVLGAYGCGCFKNDTTEVAQIFMNTLNSPRYKNRFKTISFSITEKSKLEIFKNVFNYNQIL